MPASLRVAWRSAAQKRRITEGLARVEELLAGVAGRYPGKLGEACLSTLDAGGKRVRPALVLLSARRTGPLGEPVLRAAASVELLHMATLVHDDVLDGAELRRGRPTVAAHAGVSTAVSAGNYLLAEAFAQLAATGNGRAVDLLSAVALGLSEGELLQMDEAFDVTLTADDYLRRCLLKTADLFAASAQLGALLSGVDEVSVDALAGYGRGLGIAFQIFDDILDFSGDEARTGKRVGTDLRDGTVTLPIVLALGRRPHLAPLVAKCGDDEDRVPELVAEIVASGALQEAREVALERIDQARADLERCSDQVERELLAQVAGSVVDRFS
jgi:octaprenyl-diphosphate synthase